MASAHAEPRRRVVRRTSWPLVAAGVALLTLGLLAYVYAVSYVPRQKTDDTGRINHIEPTLTTAAPSSTEAPTPTPSPTPRERSEAPLPSTDREVAAVSFVAASYKEEPRRLLMTTAQAAPDAVSTQTAQPSPTPQPRTGKGNPFGRLFRWLFGWLRPEKKTGAPNPNLPPVISSARLSPARVVVPTSCPAGRVPDPACDASGVSVRALVSAQDPDGDMLRVNIVPLDGGASDGDVWDLSGAAPGVYRARLTVSDGRSEVSSEPLSVVVSNCNCVPVAPSACPQVRVSGPERLRPGQPVNFNAEVTGIDPSARPTFNWTVSAGTISGGQGTDSIKVDTAGLSGGQTVTATVDVGGFDRHCSPSASATTLLAFTADPTDHYELRITVKGRDGSPLNGARVQIFTQGGVLVEEARQIGPGLYMARPPKATYRATVTGPNGETASGTVGVEMPVVTLTLPPSIIESVTPTPTPTPSLSPTPTPTPGTTPTPSPTPGEGDEDKVGVQDKVVVTYPERFLEDRQAAVTFTLEQVKRAVVSSQTTSNGMNEFTDKVTVDIPGAKQGAGLGGAFENYDAFVSVGIVGLRGLKIDAEPEAGEQQITGRPLNWRWLVSTNGDDSETASFRFRLRVVWRHKETRAPMGGAATVWDKTFEAPVGPPAQRVAARYGSPVLFGGGLFAVVVGVRRKRLEDLLDEGGSESIPVAPVPPTRDASEGAAGGEATEAAAAVDEVHCTVFSPPEALPGDGFLVQVFAHLEGQSGALEELAREADPEARRQVSKALKNEVARGAELTFHLILKGLEVEPASQSATWEGEPLSVQFGVTVPEDFKPRKLFGEVVVCEDTVPVGRMMFTVRILAPGVAPRAGREPAGGLQRFRQAFISYSSADRPEVMKRVQMLHHARVPYFMDLLTLEAGQDWEKEIYRRIDESDVFFLFWSQAASRSVYVKKEVERAALRKAEAAARERKDRDEVPPSIVPVNIEGTQLAPPPEDLKWIHFNDKFCYFINTPKA